MIVVKLGYIVDKIGTTERILPHAIKQQFEIGPDGTLELVTAGSTRPTSVVRHWRRCSGGRAVRPTSPVAATVPSVP